jgi:hypothetical protein
MAEENSASEANVRPATNDYDSKISKNTFSQQLLSEFFICQK